MKSMFKTRWVMVCIIWVGAMLLTGWNTHRIDKIIPARQKDEILQMDAQFWKYNSEKVSRILKKSESICQPIESVKMGLLSVDNCLKTLAANHHLAAVKVECCPGQANEGSIPVDLAFRGAFDGAIDMLDTLEKNYLYLPVNNVRISIDQSMQQIRFKVSLDYRYKIFFPGRTAYFPERTI